MPLERAIGRAILRELGGSGLSATKMISIARNYGGGYRYQDMLNDVRKFTGRLKYESQVKGLSRDAVVPKSWLTEADQQRPYRYRVFADATFEDSATGETSTRTVSFYSDEVNSKGGYEDDFEESQRGRYSDEGEKLIGVKVKAVEHNRGLPY